MRARSIFDINSSCCCHALFLVVVCMLMSSMTVGYQHAAAFRRSISRSDTSSSSCVNRVNTINKRVAVASSKQYGDSDSNGVEWGISYIGQDVCGSKYNDDPFDEQSDKPDAWTLMKARIAEIEKKVALEAANVNNNSTLTKPQVSTSAPPPPQTL